jgi:DNA modification methylase
MSKERKREPFARLTWERKDHQPVVPADLNKWAEVFPQNSLQDSEFQGRLILGDNLPVMHSLLPDYEGRIQLIYADPPFLTGKAYRARIGHNEDSRRPEEWQTVKSYQDRWKDGGEYLDMLYPRLELMWRLLSPTGSLYLHLDWHASAYARILLDQIFGPDRLMNEIVWVYHGPSPIKSAFNRKHDTILIYTKTKDYTFNVDDVRIPYDPSTVKTFASSPRAGFGKKPDLDRGKVPEDWWYFPVVARLHNERTGYPTQKPEAMMERIILASSNPGDIVADFFSGSGTTPSVSARLGRHWIACDPEPTALQVSHRRMIGTECAAPYSIEMAGSTHIAEPLTPEVTTSSDSDILHLKLESVQDNETGEKLTMDHIVLWEVDPRYDGHIFRSRYQEIRPWRKDSINPSISIPKAMKNPKPVAIRVMDAAGRAGSIQLEATFLYM